MTPDKNDLGEIIKLRRLAAGLTLRELAAISGVSASHLGRIQRGERFPSAHILRKIAKSLGFDEVDLLTHAGFLSPQSATIESGIGKLDPYVAGLLSQEPIEVQRTFIGILSILKSIAKGVGCNIEFAEYIHRNYPEVDEDIITMFENILEHPPGS